MASWTTPVTHAAGDLLSVSDWNGLANDATFLYQAPYAMFGNTAATSIPAAAFTVVSMTMGLNNYGIGQTGQAASTSVAGVYRVSAAVAFATSTAVGYAYIYKNGVQYAQGSQSTGNGVYGPASTVSALVQMNGTTDYVNVRAYQASGGAVNTSGSSLSTYMHLDFVGSL